MPVAPATPPRKFVQIATAIATTGTTMITRTLALDDAGRVWEYQAASWWPLAETRAE